MDWIGLLKGSLAFVKKQKATTLVIAVLVAIVFLQRACIKPEIVIDYRDVLIHDTTVIMKDTTIYKDSIVKQLVPYYVDVHHFDTVFVDVDSMAILSDYFASKFYLDTLSNDTTLFAVSGYKVSKNKLERQSFEYSILRPQTINNTTTITNPPKNTLYLDGWLGGNTSQFSASAGLSFVNKKKQKYSFSYDFVNKTYHIGMGFKLFEYGKFK